MEQISNETMSKCQSCGEWTNFAESEHYKEIARNAERYRWLRSGLEAGRSEAHQIARAGCGLDAAIDAAMNGANAPHKPRSEAESA